MSLIIANSNKYIYNNNNEVITESLEQAYNYQCRFKDPIVLKPNSVIEVVSANLQNANVIKIDESNELIQFQYGPKQEGNPIIPVYIPHGTYSGDGLADAINKEVEKMNLNSTYHFLVNYDDNDSLFYIYTQNFNADIGGSNFNELNKFILEENINLTTPLGGDEYYTNNGIIYGNKFETMSVTSLRGQPEVYHNHSLDTPHNVIKTYRGNRFRFLEPGQNFNANEARKQHDYDSCLISNKSIHTGQGHHSVVITPHKQIKLDVATFTGSNRECQVFKDINQNALIGATFNGNPITLSLIDTNMDTSFITSSTSNIKRIFLVVTSGMNRVNSIRIATSNNKDLFPRNLKIHGASLSGNIINTLYTAGDNEINWRSNRKSGTAEDRQFVTIDFNNYSPSTVQTLALEFDQPGEVELACIQLFTRNVAEPSSVSETMQSYTGSNGYDARVNYQASDNYYLKFITDADLGSGLGTDILLETCAYRHLLIVNKTDKAIDNALLNNDFVLQLNGVHDRNKSLINSYRHIESNISSEEMSISFQNTGLTAFQSALTIEKTQYYPKCALGLNKYDNVYGSFIDDNDLNSRSIIVNEGTSGVQPVKSGTNAGPRIHADAVCEVTNEQISVSYTENLLYKLDSNDNVVANNRQNVDIVRNKNITDYLSTYQNGDNIMITAVMNYNNQVGFYVGHDTQGDMVFNEQELITDNASDTNFPLTLSQVHGPVIPSVYSNSGYVYNQEMLLSQGISNNELASQQPNMNSAFNSLPVAKQNIDYDYFSLFGKLPFFKNDNTTFTYDVNINNKYQNLTSQISCDGFSGVTGNKSFSIDNAIAQDHNDGLGINTDDKLVLKLGRVSDRQVDEEYKKALNDNGVPVTPYILSTIFNSLGAEKVMVIEDHNEEIGMPYDPSNQFSHDYVITLTNLGNPKGYNSIRSDVQKIIGVLNKNELEFNSDNSVNYKPPYPLKIKLNNLKEENINNFNIQVTNGDGTLADHLINPTSIVLRITEENDKNKI